MERSYCGENHSNIPISRVLLYAKKQQIPSKINVVGGSSRRRQVVVPKKSEALPMPVEDDSDNATISLIGASLVLVTATVTATRPIQDRKKHRRGNGLKRGSEIIPRVVGLDTN